MLLIEEMFPPDMQNRMDRCRREIGLAGIWLQGRVRITLGDLHDWLSRHYTKNKNRVLCLGKFSSTRHKPVVRTH